MDGWRESFKMMVMDGWRESFKWWWWMDEENLLKWRSWMDEENLLNDDDGWIDGWIESFLNDGWMDRWTKSFLKDDDGGMDEENPFFFKWWLFYIDMIEGCCWVTLQELGGKIGGLIVRWQWCVELKTFLLSWGREDWNGLYVWKGQRACLLRWGGESSWWECLRGKSRVSVWWRI